MLRALTLLQAAPYLLGLLLLASGSAYVAGRFHGYAKAEHEHQAAGLEDLIKAVKTAAAVGEAIADIGRKLRETMIDSRAHEAQSTRTVTKVIREHPDFAAVRRPAELQRVRVDQLERIRRAAETD